MHKGRRYLPGRYRLEFPLAGPHLECVRERYGLPMLRLSKMNDYAVVVLGHMAARPGLATAPDVAEATGLPAATVSQVLKKLAHSGLVVSQRGAHGGYTLGRTPAEISVADLVEALEGPVALTACVDGAEGGCGVETSCPMRGSWDRVNGAIRAALESVTLADMLAPYAVRFVAEAGGSERRPSA